MSSRTISSPRACHAMSCRCACDAFRLNPAPIIHAGSIFTSHPHKSQETKLGVKYGNGLTDGEEVDDERARAAGVV